MQKRGRCVARSISKHAKHTRIVVAAAFAGGGAARSQPHGGVALVCGPSLSLG